MTTGIRPRDVSFIGGSMWARLTRSKTLGSYINACCFLERRELLEEGWQVLGSAAQYNRDYLLPAPSTNCNGCSPSELRYDTAFAMQNRVLYSIWKEGTSVFTKVSTSFWTPHSARAFMPSSSKALGVPKEERDYLGGWSARGSDTYARAAVRVISNLQRPVIRALIEQLNADPLAEEETITQFESSLCEKGVAPADRLRCSKQVGKVFQSHRQLSVIRIWQWKKWGRFRSKTLFPMKSQQSNRSQKCEGQTSGSRARAVELKSWGITPNEVREHARRSLEPGYHLSASARNATRIRHFLGDCHMVPGDRLCQVLVRWMSCAINRRFLWRMKALLQEKVQCESTSPDVPRPVLRRRRERSEPE